jgi:hypothetical protein
MYRESNLYPTERSQTIPPHLVNPRQVRLHEPVSKHDLVLVETKPIGKYYSVENIDPTLASKSNGLIQSIDQASVIFVTVIAQLKTFKIKETSTI